MQSQFNLTYFSVISFLFIFSPVLCVPLLGNLNANAKDSGTSMVNVEKDVVLKPGKEDNHFNAISDGGNAFINVGGDVNGSVQNRGGQEFSAISKGKGTSQVRVLGNINLQDLEASGKKFDAISESGGDASVQVGNVVISSQARREIRSSSLELLESGRNSLEKTEDESININQTYIPKVMTHKHGQHHLGPSWGAIAVAEQNSRPWEEIDHESEEDSLGNSPVSDLFQDDDTTNNHQPEDSNIPIIGISEVHDFPHENNGVTSSSEEISKPLDNIENDNSTQHPVLFPQSEGSLNANSVGIDSISTVNVKGSVEI